MKIVLFEQLVTTSSRVAATRKRTRKVSEIAGCLRHLAADEIEVGVAFLSGEIRQRRIGVAYATIAELREVEPATASTLTVQDVDEALAGIANTSGPGSAGVKRELLGRLLSRATPIEQDFLRRLLVGEVRQGALESLVVDAIAEAFAVPVATVRRAHMLESNLGTVARVALQDPSGGLGQFEVALFKPVKPMLASTANDVDDALNRLRSVILDYKLDGARVQVHKSGDEVRVYSRRLNNVTAGVPELVDQVLALPARSLILDGETLAMRPDGRPHPFQTTMRRFGRRQDNAVMRARLPLTTYYFDCLLIDDERLIDEPMARRAEALGAVARNAVVPRLVTDSLDAAHGFMRAAGADGHEGIMVKSIDAGYQAGARGADWLKVKFTHTLDLVVLAAEWGSGRRKGWLSNLHLGARDPASGSLIMLGKTFKGLTDQMLEWQTRRLLELEVERRGPVVYVRPEIVVEIAFNDVQSSPHYPGGLALRFARVKRYRSDKSPDQADTLATVREIHRHALR